MSSLLGPVGGALVAGGVYYGFSNLISTRTAQHRRDLHSLSERLVDAPVIVPAPPPASVRITHHPFASLLQSRWNQEVESLFKSLGELDTRVLDWGRKMMYGTNTRTREQS